MQFPKKLSNLLNRMEGYNQNTYKVMPLNADTVSAGKIISMRLPTNCLFDLSQFTMVFDLSTSNKSSGGTTHARFPNNLSSFIYRYEVLAGSQTISQGFNDYGTGRIIKNIVDGSSTHRESRSVINHEFVTPQATDKIEDDYGHDIHAAAEGSVKTKGNTYFIDDFLGLFELKKVLDLGALPEISIRITMANDNVLSGEDGCKWTMENVHFMCTTVGVDGVYEQIVERKIKEDKVIEIPFKQYYSISQRHSNSTRFSVSSQSVDRIFGVFRDSAYATIGLAVDYDGFAGYKLSKYNNFVSGTSKDLKTQYSINHILYPQYQASKVANLKLLKQASMKETNEVYSLRTFLNNQFIVPLTLCATPDTDNIDGFDSRNTASICELNTIDLVPETNKAFDSYILIETTSSLLIGAGKALEVRL